MASLADRYQKRIDREGSFLTEKGTKVTQSTVDAIRGDEAVAFVITENNAAQLKAAIGDSIIAALEEIGLVAEGAAKRLCPVDTGRLRNSITHALDAGDKWVIIGTNVEYAMYVHEPVRLPNGKTRPGTPFLRDAVQHNQNRFHTILKKHMRGA